MDSINKIDLFVMWTPLAVYALLAEIVVLFVIGLMLWVFRAEVRAWIAARWVEKSSADARSIALGTTAVYIGSRLGIPTVDPVSLSVVIAGWAVALWKFIRPDPAAPAAQTGQGGQ